MKWKYGNSWEKYPIEVGEIWQDKKTGSKVSVCDLTDELPNYMMNPDMIYCDPPWNLGNANGFITKAGGANYLKSFKEFYSNLFLYISIARPWVCFVEIGRQNIEIFKMELSNIYPIVQIWPITYYRHNACFLLRGGISSTCYDFSGMDDKKIPFASINVENPISVADPCTGQGLTTIAAHNLGKRFYGTDLNKRRLAVAIDRVNRLGAHYEKSAIS